MSAAILKNSPNVRENVPSGPFWAAILKEKKRASSFLFFEKNRTLNMFFLVFFGLTESVIVTVVVFL